MLLASSAAYSQEWYRWEDEQGVIHITDDLGRVPPEYRDKAEVIKTSPSEPPAPSPTPSPGAAAPAEPREGLYGGQSLQWWTEEISAKRKQIESLRSQLELKEHFISIFEGGRRFGKTFTAEEITRYETYKKELPEDKARLEELTSELDSLIQRASAAGVPPEAIQ